MSFIRPDYILYFVLASLLIGLFCYRTELVRKERLAAFAKLSSKRGALAYLVPTFIAALMLFALCRPHIGFEEIKLPQIGQDLMVVFDVSQSMLSDDLSPSRLEAAKRKLSDLIDLVEGSQNGDRLGIVLFAGDSYLYCPLTADYAILRTFAKSIGVDLISSGGSAIMDAFNTSLASLEEVKAAKPRILLISDGEDDSLVLDKLIAKLSAKDISVDTLGLGTLAGKPIKLRDGSFVKNQHGEIVISKLKEEALKKLSQATGGKYFRARLDDQDLKIILRGKEALSIGIGTDSDKTFRIYKEIGPLLLWLALLLILAFISWGRYDLIFAFLVCLNSLSYAAAEEQEAKSESPPPSLYALYRAYQDGKYELARKGFEAHYKQDTEDLELMQALASSYYKEGKYKEAFELFSKLKEAAINPRQRFEAFYNTGNAAFMQKDLESAIKNYEEALKIKKEDEKTTHNLELAKKLLEEQKQQEQQEEEQKSCDNPKEDQDKEKQQNNKDSKQDQGNKDKQKEKDQEQESTDKNEENSKEQEREKQQDSKKQENQQEEQSEESKPEQQEQEAAEQQKEEQEMKKGSGQALPQHSKEELKEMEAKAWLQSLSDAPVLLRRKSGQRRGGQTQSW